MNELLKNKYLQGVAVILALYFSYVLISESIANRENEKAKNKAAISQYDQSQLNNSKEFYSSLALSCLNQFKGVDFSGVEREQLLIRVNQLNDDELTLVSNYYYELSGENETLRNAIDSEIMPFTNIDETIIKRLNQLGIA